MLVFGESILNDAVSILLTQIFLPTDNVEGSEAFVSAIKRFCMMFFASAGIGAVFALIVALLLKYIGKRFSLNFHHKTNNFLNLHRSKKKSIFGICIATSLHLLSVRTS